MLTFSISSSESYYNCMFWVYLMISNKHSMHKKVTFSSAKCTRSKMCLERLSGGSPGRMPFSLPLATGQVLFQALIQIDGSMGDLRVPLINSINESSSTCKWPTQTTLKRVKFPRSTKCPECGVGREGVMHACCSMFLDHVCISAPNNSMGYHSTEQ